MQLRNLCSIGWLVRMLIIPDDEACIDTYDIYERYNCVDDSEDLGFIYHRPWNAPWILEIENCVLFTSINDICTSEP